MTVSRMKILFLTTAFNSLGQRAFVELRALGHQVSIELAIKNEWMEEAIELFQPDLVVAPFLKTILPASIWKKCPCLIVHPGIHGDRGPSSLDWAILQEHEEWGVTILQAVAEVDAGDVWSTQNFPMRVAAKSSLYRREVTETAIESLLRVIQRYSDGDFRPEPLNYNDPSVKGRQQPVAKQAARAFDWTQPTDVIHRRILSGDSQPGVLTQIEGEELFVFGPHPEDELRGEPGRILAVRDDAICVGTGDGAIWISHLRRPSTKETVTIKLPAAHVLGSRLRDVPVLPLSPFAARHGRTYREIRYEEHDSVGHLHFDFYNGAMSTSQCERLIAAYRFAQQRPTRAIVLWGGTEFWSNGIHLNTIEAATDPAEESWRNINAINDLVLAILTTTDKITISAIQGNAGAGGVMLALAADKVVCRRAVVLNPHYKGMGNLFGSEYWTYSLPKRVGQQMAQQITTSLLPLGAEDALRIGMIDAVFPTKMSEFRHRVQEYAARLVTPSTFSQLLHDKNRRRSEDEVQKPLQQYRDEELANMRANFWGPDPAYNEARRRFVHKAPACRTPRHLAMHRI